MISSVIKIMLDEDIRLHRDAYPHIVIALKGGIITRLEANGSATDVQFPTGEVVMRGVDPLDELHKSFNKSKELLELIISQLKKN